jgi:hypothetical protein
MKFLLVVLVCVGWSTFWSPNYALHAMPGELTRSDTEAPSISHFGTMSPKAAAILESNSKGPEPTLANYWNFSEESRSRVNEIFRHYSLSPNDQNRSDESKRRTAESVELARKSKYLPRD